MNSFEFRIKSVALDDIELIADYIAKDNKKIAKELVETFYKTFNLICTQPKIGNNIKRFHDKEVRFLTINKHYLIIYKQIDSEIVILRVLSTYQDICNIL